MLKVIGLVAAGFVLAVVAVIAWLYARAVRGQQRAYGALLHRISAVTEALARGETPQEALLERFAANRETRKVLFDVLDEAKRRDLFPPEYLAWDKLAEADLIAWLCHPNELGAPPSEIELAAQVPAPASTLADATYFVFKYRMREPHWAAKDGWLAGVAGPYDTSGAPCSSARGTFSRFERFESRTPEEHVAAVHQSVVGDAGTRRAEKT
jgi:hypothetical protein